MTFDIGDKVFLVDVARHEQHVTCPTCFGDLRLKVTLGDGTELFIPCRSCADGYDPPRGIVTTYGFSAKVRQGEVTGIELQQDGRTQYQVNYGYIGDTQVFKSREEAEAEGLTLLKKRMEKEQERLERKTKDHKSWAWHVTYHRQQIKGWEKDIVHAKAQLAVAERKRQKP